ncbi:MAG: hypothetical protein IPI35_20460 [Deltaproteobacteria bacterium]|nr:hypothetical protein [Deltaproteobacteria bacterium]
MFERLSRSRARSAQPAINDLQDHSAATRTAVGELLSTMYPVRGMPHGGLELILFAGNYAATPFGVHRGFEHAFLCHIGPGNKRFPLWSPEHYQTVTGSLDDVLVNWEWLLEHAIDLTLKPGDMLYLPAQWFHIGIQDEYSVSVAIGLYDWGIDRWAPTAMKSFFERLTPQARMPYMPPSSTGNPFRDVVEEPLDLAIRPALVAAADDSWFWRVSYGGFTKDESMAPPVPIRREDHVRLVSPCRVCWTEPPGGRMAIYLRYRKVTVGHHPSLAPFFRRINTSDTIPVADLLDTAQDWSESSALELISLLVSTGGLSVVERRP